MGGGRFIPGLNGHTGSKHGKPKSPAPYHHFVTSHNDNSRDALAKETLLDDFSSDLSEFTLQESMRDLINNSRFSMSQHSDYRNSSEEEREDRGWRRKREDSSSDSHDSEKGTPDTPPPAPVGFWDSRLKSTRRAVYLQWGKTTLILAVFILTVLSLYWGSLSHVEKNLSSLVVYVVDFDAQLPPYQSTSPIIGPMVTQLTEQINSVPDMHLGYVTLPPSQFNNDPLAVRQAVYDFHCWAAIIINANATANLQQAVQTGNAAYDPLGAAQMVYVEARDQDTYFSYVIPQITHLQEEVAAKIPSTWVAPTLANTSIPRANLLRSPQALSPAVSFATYNLRPFRPAVIIPAVTVGLIYLIIISFFSFSFFLPTHMKLLVPNPSIGKPPMKFNQWILWRYLATIVAYLLMSLAYSFVSLAFQIPFTTSPAPTTQVANNHNAFGHGTFAVFWMINFVGMGALGLACENVAMIVGQPWTAMWLIFWVISNVSTSFYAIELMPKFYYWGYAWPLHQVVEASRMVLFDLHDRIGLYFGILFAWVAVNSVLFPACCYFARWKLAREKRKQG